MLRRWEDLPEDMKNDLVKKYYEILYKKKLSLFIKRIFDIVISIIIFILLFPVSIIISIIIKLETKGPVMFQQVRVTQYGKRFKILKFRTMVNNADKIGAHITSDNDTRITKVGEFLRKYRLDEIPQLLNIISGNMSFVGVRPEVVEYVEKYTDEMKATLLIKAGVTSETSIQYKDEVLLLTDNAEDIYINVVLPEKMKYNLRSIEEFSLFGDIKTMFRTLFAVIKNEKVKTIK